MLENNQGGIFLLEQAPLFVIIIMYLKHCSRISPDFRICSSVFRQLQMHCVSGNGFISNLIRLTLFCAHWMPILSNKSCFLSSNWYMCCIIKLFFYKRETFCCWVYRQNVAIQNCYDSLLWLIMYVMYVCKVNVCIRCQWPKEKEFTEFWSVIRPSKYFRRHSWRRV